MVSVLVPCVRRSANAANMSVRATRVAHAFLRAASPLMATQGSGSPSQGHPISKTVRGRMLPDVAQTFSTSESGMSWFSIAKPPGTVACIKSSIDFSIRSTGILPMPLPSSVMAEERSAALGSVISGAAHRSDMYEADWHRLFPPLPRQ